MAARETITLSPEVLRWARLRAGYTAATLAEKLRASPEEVSEWEESGEVRLGRVEKLAHATHTPLGFLYLAEPPDDQLPIRDFRTVGDQPLGRASPDLLDVVHTMQLRQAWLRSELIEQGSSPRTYVASRTKHDDPNFVAAEIRDTLGLQDNWATLERSWTHALVKLREAAERAGIVAVANSVVDNNTHRSLDPDEFRGFALVDAFAPLIFVNAADAKAAQMFTLAHELAHIWIGAEGVSNFVKLEPAPNDTERFCNKVAAELLVPESKLREFWPRAREDPEPFQAIARHFKVSSLVGARRALDLQLITRPAFRAFYEAYLTDDRRQREARDGEGNFWNTLGVRLGKNFTAAVVRAVRDDRLLYRDAYRLTGLKPDSFAKLLRRQEGLL